MYRHIAIAVVFLCTMLAGTALADNPVPTTTDEAREAAGRANAQAAFPPAPVVPQELEAWDTTTDGIRMTFARTQYRNTVMTRRARAAQQPVMIATTTDEAREVIGQMRPATEAPEPTRLAQPTMMMCPHEPGEPCDCAAKH